jgi:hypothetical protein
MEHDMPEIKSIVDAENTDGATLLMLKSQESRIAQLESGAKKTFFKRLTESASLSALFLGLVLTFVSLRDAFVTKPEADRISRLSSFNQSVNSAAQKRQELMKLQLQNSAPELQLAMGSAATTQILNDISTARAMLRDLSNSDVGISQLTVLINESFTAGDMESAKTFVTRAVNLTGLTGYERSEALRQEGRYFFVSGDFTKVRPTYMSALNALGEAPIYTAARAYDLADLIPMEYTFDCENAKADTLTFVKMITSPNVQPQAKSQMVSSLLIALGQLPPEGCPEVVRNLKAVANTKPSR